MVYVGWAEDKEGLFQPKFIARFTSTLTGVKMNEDCEMLRGSYPHKLPAPDSITHHLGHST